MTRSILDALVLAYFAALATTFAFITPIGSGFDENGHLNYVGYVARTGHIPNQYIAEQSVPLEGHQPPLYYFLAAGCLRVLGTHDALAGGYLLRLVSVLLATFNLALVFRIAAYFPLTGCWRLAPALFVATLPQFAFVSGMVSNDSLANLMAAAVICSLLAIHARPLEWPAYISLGCCLGLGITYQKDHLLLDTRGAGIVVGYVLWQTHGQRRLIVLRSVGAIAVCVMLSGWWFYAESASVRRVARYDDGSQNLALVLLSGSESQRILRLPTLLADSPILGQFACSYPRHSPSLH